MQESKETPSRAIFLVLPIFALILALAVFLIMDPSRLDFVGGLAAPAAEPQKLAASPAASKTQAGPETIPVWIWFLTLGFTVVQMGSVSLAAMTARKVPLGTREFRMITFYCDTPMYLGLLGSLVGVCGTQFLTANLMAPVAYLTSITGIVIHLLGKWLVVLPLPERAGYAN